MTIKGNFLTDKGQLKSAARATILAGIAENPAILGTAEQVNAMGHQWRTKPASAGDSIGFQQKRERSELYEYNRCAV
jgi:hypothetical protein